MGSNDQHDAGSLRIIHRSSGQFEGAQQLGPYQLEWLIWPEEELTATAYRVRIAPRQTTATSFHRIAEEFYFVLSGQGIAILNDQQYVLRAGDFLRLPPGTTHRFITSDEPLEMLNIHCPGSRPDRDVFFVDAPPPGFGAAPMGNS